MRNESRRVWSLQVEEGGIVQEVLRKQAGFTKKEISRAKFLPDGIRKNGTRCRVTEKTLTGDSIGNQFADLLIAADLHVFFL